MGEIGPGEVGLDEAGPGEVGCGELSPGEVGPEEVSPEEVGPGEVSPERLASLRLASPRLALLRLALLRLALLRSGLIPVFCSRHAFHVSTPCSRIWRCSGFAIARVSLCDHSASDKKVYVNQTGGLHALEQHGSDHVMQGTDAGGSRLHAFGQGSP